MGIESVPDPADHLRLGVPFVDPPTHLVRAVPHRARLGHRHMAPACLGLAAEKQMTSSLALVFIVGPRRTAGLSRHGRAFFANQLLTRLINGARGPLRIVRFLLQLHDVLPPSHELRAYGRQAPLLRVPRLETVSVTFGGSSRGQGTPQSPAPRLCLRATGASPARGPRGVEEGL